MHGQATKADMPVVILCGGQGTRLREETGYRPKPMVEIGERPILWHIMKIYGHHGFDRFVLCLGYLGWEIKQYFLRHREYLRDFTVRMDGQEPPEFHNRVGDESWRVTCAETGAESGNAHRIWRVRPYLDTQTFLCTYGDGVADLDLDRLLDFHRREGRLATVTGVHPTSRFGEMHLDGTRATEFNEKPTVAEGVVSGGFFVFERGVFDYFDDDPGLFLETGPLPKLARAGQLAVYLHEGFWHSMDTYRDYLALNKMWSRGESPWKVWKG
jgi:glucose-1-phosphate cytidylyltransferase